MSMVKEALHGKGDAYAGKNSPVANLKYGGQNGLMSRMGMKAPDGKNYSEWISSQAHIKQSVICVVIQYPRFLDYMPDSAKWIETYKKLLEEHPETIAGLTSGLTVATDEHAFGAAGEMQEEILNVTRARTTLSMEFVEKLGRAIQKFLGACILYGKMDADTKRPLVMQFIDNLDDIGGYYTADMYSGTAIFIQTDITGMLVDDAWLCTNLFHKSDGDRTGKKDLKAGGEITTLSIEFASITINTENTFVLAEKILTDLSVFKAIPDVDMQLPVSEIDPNIAAVE